MKVLFLAALLSTSAFAATAFASEVSFKCDFSDLTSVNQFSLEGKNVQYEDGKFENVEFDFTFRKAGHATSVQRLSIFRDGDATPINGGINPSFKALQLTSISKGDDMEYINLVIGAAPQYASQVRFLSGMTYFGTCKEI